MPPKKRPSVNRDNRITKNKRGSVNLPRRPSISKRKSTNKAAENRKNAAKGQPSTPKLEKSDRHSPDKTDLSLKEIRNLRGKSTDLNPADIETQVNDDIAADDEQKSVILKGKKGWVETLLKETSSGLDNLWEQYKDIVKETADVSSCAAFDANPSKNRYGNVKCWDTTRVVLNPPNDYIHANYVDGYKRDKEFILTQGPMKTTLEDFWTMIWKENIVVIVMLCNIVEEKKDKCEPYWNENVEKTMTFGAYEITTLSRATKGLQDDQKVEVTELELKSSKEKDAMRNIIHYNYRTWPDKSVPRTDTVVVQFYQKIRLIQRSMEKTNSLGHSPLLIHCSAGIGRSGCFAALAICYKQLETTGKVDCAAVVKSLRRQRALSVQNGIQYLYLHLILLATLGKQNQIDYSAFKQAFYDKYEKMNVG